jgi:hypothetical protein
VGAAAELSIKSTTSLARFNALEDDSDESESIYKRDASNGLSWDKVEAEIDKSHPRKWTYDGMGRSKWTLRPICGTNTGFFSMRKENRESDLQEYGSGIVLYFQFLKYLGCVFFVLSLLSLPSMFFFYSGNMSHEGSMKGIITALSMGNIGEARTACSTGRYQDIRFGNNNPTLTISLTCANGYLDEIEEFG